MFNEENLISLDIFLSFCLSVHKPYYEAMYFSQNFYFFCEIFVLFFREISRENEMRKQREVVAKRLFLFAGNPNQDFREYYRTVQRDTF